MHRLGIISALLALAAALSAGASTPSATAPARDSRAALVNTMMGLGGDGFAASNMFGGVSYPFGMVQMTPSPYNRNLGFVTNQLNGTGGPHQGNFPMLPMKGAVSVSPGPMTGGKIQISDEKGHAGFYEAMTEGDVHCELSATRRTGMARLSFPGGEMNSVLIGSGFCAMPELEVAAAVITSPHSCEGYAKGTSFCNISTPYIVYFYAEFDQDAAETGVWKGDRLTRGGTFTDGAESGLYFTFKDAASVNYKVALSYVSADNARLNLLTENPGWDFDAVRGACEAEWNRNLNLIDVEGTYAGRVQQFYNHLYHACLHPNIFSDVNGEYIGSDFRVHRSMRDVYTTFSNWDTYRTQIQLLSMIRPDVASDLVYSHYLFAEQAGGALPRWVMFNIETGIMQGDPSTILIANAWAFGARGYDPKKLYAIMKRGAVTPGLMCQNYEVRPHLQEYIDMTTVPASLCLEYNSADFALSRFASEAAGEVFDADPFLRRAQSWKKMFNPENQWLQTKNADGSWKEFNYGWQDYMEASYQCYFWMVPFNIRGLIETIGMEKAEQRLDEHLTRLDAGFFDDWFAITNEPSFQIPWTYNWMGKPWKTSQTVNRILNESFNIETGNGMPGNEDVGAMGAWYIFACSGIYPFIPGVGGFTVNTPVFEKIVYHLPGGDLAINGGSESKIYTAGLKLDGEAFDSTWIPWTSLAGGATLDFKTSTKPSKTWGVSTAPPSYDCQ